MQDVMVLGMCNLTYLYEWTALFLYNVMQMNRLSIVSYGGISILHAL